MCTSSDNDVNNEVTLEKIGKSFEDRKSENIVNFDEPLLHLSNLFLSF